MRKFNRNNNAAKLFNEKNEQEIYKIFNLIEVGENATKLIIPFGDYVDKTANPEVKKQLYDELMINVFGSGNKDLVDSFPLSCKIIRYSPDYNFTNENGLNIVTSSIQGGNKEIFKIACDKYGLQNLSQEHKEQALQFAITNNITEIKETLTKELEEVSKKKEEEFLKDIEKEGKAKKPKHKNKKKPENNLKQKNEIVQKEEFNHNSQIVENNSQNLDLKESSQIEEPIKTETHDNEEESLESLKSEVSSNQQENINQRSDKNLEYYLRNRIDLERQIENSQKKIIFSEDQVKIMENETRETDKILQSILEKSEEIAGLDNQKSDDQSEAPSPSPNALSLDIVLKRFMEK
jgi:hypothetical protein